MWLILLLILTGLATGSFVGALTYRLPRDISIFKGRSKCAKCKVQIKFYDNIPVLSYLVLGGRCRSCGKKISVRYPVIEFLVMGVILLVGLNFESVLFNLPWLSDLGMWGLPYLLIVVFLMMTIFVVDWEFQIVPDELVFIGIFVTVLFMLGSGFEGLFVNLFSGMAASVFFLCLHLVTRGKGMGLGDVKLALFGGMVLGGVLSVVWIFLSFILGAVVGILMLAGKKVKMGQQLAFGPFMAASFIFTLLLGKMLLSYVTYGI